MKKFRLISLVVAIATLLSFGTSTIAFADDEPYSTAEDWMPHEYVLSGTDVGSQMISNPDGTLTFTGSKNGIMGTTGFCMTKPVKDLKNFDLDLTLDIPNIDRLMWISFSFLDTNLMMDPENLVAPVALPFNAFGSALGGYKNTLQHGAVFQIYTHANQGDTSGTNVNLKTDNTVKVIFAEKTLDCDDPANFDLSKWPETNGFKPRDLSGEDADNQSLSWHEMRSKFVSYIKLDDKYSEGNWHVNLGFKPNRNDASGIEVNINDGRWKSYNPSSGYSEAWGILNLSTLLKGFLSYFSSRDCYFGVTLKYEQDKTDENVSVKINSINGIKPCDGKAPTYGADKVIEKDAIKTTIKKSDIGAFGVYPRQITDLKITKYDDSDVDYQTATSRAKKLKLDMLDYFSVYPIAEQNVVPLKSEGIQISYNLPKDYSDFKIYYINSEYEAQALENVNISDGVATFTVNNDDIEKIIVYGKKGEPAPQKSGCGSALECFTILPLCLVVVGIVTVIIKRKAR